MSKISDSRHNSSSLVSTYCIHAMPTISSLVQEKSLWKPRGVQVVRFGWMNDPNIAANKEDEKGYLPACLEQCVWHDTHIVF